MWRFQYIASPFTYHHHEQVFFTISMHLCYSHTPLPHQAHLHRFWTNPFHSFLLTPVTHLCFHILLLSTPHHVSPYHCFHMLPLSTPHHVSLSLLLITWLPLKFLISMWVVKVDLLGGFVAIATCDFIFHLLVKITNIISSCSLMYRNKVSCVWGGWGGG